MLMLQLARDAYSFEALDALTSQWPYFSLNLFNSSMRSSKWIVCYRFGFVVFIGGGGTGSAAWKSLFDTQSLFLSSLYTGGVVIVLCVTSVGKHIQFRKRREAGNSLDLRYLSKITASFDWRL